MSEPNDTAQEGFDQLKRNLEVRYPEDSDLSLDEFLNVKSLLALAVRVCGPVIRSTSNGELIPAQAKKYTLNGGFAETIGSFGRRGGYASAHFPARPYTPMRKRVR